MKTKTLADFQICINVPLNAFEISYLSVMTFSPSVKVMSLVNLKPERGVYYMLRSNPMSTVETVYQKTVKTITIYDCNLNETL